MMVLGIDCAGAACSAAVVTDGTRVAAQQEAMTRGQAERLIPMIAEVLATSGIAAQQLDAIAVTVGPGAFTGVRIGLSAALGLARAAGRPAWGVSVTEVLAAAIPVTPSTRLLVALDSKRPDPFCELFDATPDGWTGRGAQAVFGNPDSLIAYAGTPDPAAPLMLAGDFAPALHDILGHGAICPQSTLCDPVLVATTAIRARDAGRPCLPTPMYLRPADVSSPAKDRARRPGATTAAA